MMKTALVCIACNEDKYIDDWLNYHHALGYDDIFVFMNNWRYRSPDSHSFFIPLDGDCKQIEAYNIFLKLYRNDYDYATFIDVDEYVVLKKHSCIKELFADYIDVPCLALNWKMFGSSGLKIEDSRPVFSRFRMSQNGVNKHIKTSINLKFCRDKNLKTYFINPHFCTVIGISPERTVVKGPFNTNGSDNIAYIAHYATKSEEECKERRTRKRADTALPREEGWEAFFKMYDINEVKNDDVYNLYELECFCLKHGYDCETMRKLAAQKFGDMFNETR